MDTHMQQPTIAFRTMPDWGGFRQRVRHLANLIGRYMDSGDGFTMDSTGRRVIRDAWSVSLKSNETRFRGKPAQAELVADIADKLSVVDASEEDLFFGGWPDDGCYYLDLNHLIEGQAEAVAFAQDHEQKAIYHLWTGQLLAVPRLPNRRRAA